MISSSASDRPLFLVGALRSGTTMARLMLDHHPEICWFGEFDYAFDRVGDDDSLPNLDEYVRWLGTHRIFRSAGFEIDRELDYIALVSSFMSQARCRSGKRLVGATIHRHFRTALRIWPKARMIHIVRDPRDVARSWVNMGWAGSVWLAARGWIDAEREWDLTRHQLSQDQFIEVRYEQLVRQPAEELARVCGFMRVEFDEAMLGYVRDSTYDSPDPQLLSQWKGKLSDREVQLVEGRVGELLVARGYESSGLSPLPPRILEEAWRRVHSRVASLVRGINRYGFGLWARERALRKLGSTKQWRRARLEMNDVDQALLK